LHQVKADSAKGKVERLYDRIILLITGDQNVEDV
jgi:hypothetical protein